MVRIIARHVHNVHNQDLSLGSGTLIAKKANYGFIITNWHVIRDSSGYVKVWFPDKREYEAAVVAVDDLWDLALLVISEPKGIEPVVISPTIPKIGETYWVAGYRGDGAYRIHGGRCMKFQSPDPNLNIPELVEIEVPSENGDSGGPVFNAKRELAGVLFGSDSMTTMASHCGRVFKFLEQAAPNVASLPATPEPVIKAASLSNQSILQRGAIALGSPATQETRPVAVQRNTYSTPVSSSSSFGGNGIRARNNTQETTPQTFTLRKRHGFLNLDYDLSVANALLAAERRTGANSQITTPVSGNFPLTDSSIKNSPADVSSGNTARNVPPIHRTDTPGNTQGSFAASSAMTDLATTQTVVTPNYGNMASYPQSTDTNVTSGRSGQTAQPTQQQSFASRFGTGTVAAEPVPAAETLPVSLSQTTISQTTFPQTAGTSPAYGGNANRSNANASPGNPNNDRQGRPVSGTTAKSATGTFDTPTRRGAETTAGGTRNGAGNSPNSGSTPSGATSGGRSAPSSTSFNTYGQNSTSQQPSSTNTSDRLSWLNEDSQYGLNPADMEADDIAAKYADEFDANLPGATVSGATSKYDAIKIVIAILVIFFILFHTIKTMAVAEEKRQLASG